MVNNEKKWGIRNAILLTSAIFLLWITFSLQITTLIGAAFLALYGAIVTITKYANTNYFRHYKAVLGVILLVIIISAALFYSELRDIFMLFNNYPLWAQGNVNNKIYYLYTLKADYPLLFSIYPALIILAIYKYPKASICLSAIFIGGLAVHSLAAIKSERYILYLLPMFIITIAIALSVIFKYLYKILVEMFEHALKNYATNTGTMASHIMATLCLIFTLMFLVINTEAIKSAPLMMVKNDMQNLIKDT